VLIAAHDTQIRHTAAHRSGDPHSGDWALEQWKIAHAGNKYLRKFDPWMSYILSGNAYASDRARL
jgi:hypothetical protein